MVQALLPKSGAAAAVLAAAPAASRGRAFAIVMMAMLTTVDLFAVQAILPSLAAAYAVSPAAIGTAANASTLGMAAGGILVALLGRRVDRRRGVAASLALLAIPTALLALAPDLAVFTALRVVQGVFMAAAFTLTLAALGEDEGGAGAFAAYITGNVAGNLFGRLLSAAVADRLGLAPNFLIFAALNLAGAALAIAVLRRGAHAADPGTAMNGAARRAPLSVWTEHLRNARLRAGFGIGFFILFAFIGTFTYVNFVLVDAPFGLDPMILGLVYFVFAPSIVTTPLAGRAARRFGTRHLLLAALAAAALGLPLLLLHALPALLAGLVLVAAGTFMAQAGATAFVSAAATGDRGAASGLYLASYFLGGLAGAAVCGGIYMRLGWPACVAVIGAALAACAVLAGRIDR